MTRRKGSSWPPAGRALAARSAAAVLTSDGGGLAADRARRLLLFVLAVGSDMLTVEIRGLRVSGAFLAIVLAMALLGPAPAWRSASASALDRRRCVSRRAVAKALNNVAVWAIFPLVGGAARRSLVGDSTPGARGAVGFAASCSSSSWSRTS